MTTTMTTAPLIIVIYTLYDKSCYRFYWIVYTLSNLNPVRKAQSEHVNDIKIMSYTSWWVIWVNAIGSNDESMASWHRAYLLIYWFILPEPGISGSAIVHLHLLILHLSFLFEYWFEYITLDVFYVKVVFSLKLLYSWVPGFATACPCDVWYRGLTPCLLYVCISFFGNQINSSL